MSNRKQLGPKKKAAAERKKLNETIKEMINNPELIDYRDRLMQTSNKDFKELVDMYREHRVELLQDLDGKLLTLIKDDHVLIEYHWDSKDLKNQLLVMLKLRDFYGNNLHEINAFEIAAYKNYKEVIGMVGRLPERYDENIEGLDAYLDQLNGIALDKFCDVISFHKMTEGRDDGTLPRVRHMDESRVDYMKYLNTVYGHIGVSMFEKSTALLRERSLFRQNQRKE